MRSNVAGGGGGGKGRNAEGGTGGFLFDSADLLDAVGAIRSPNRSEFLPVEGDWGMVHVSAFFAYGRLFFGLGVAPGLACSSPPCLIRTPGGVEKKITPGPTTHRVCGINGSCSPEKECYAW